MAQQGYAGASIQAIATAAGLAPGLVHYHFDNKLEILLELVDTLAQRLDTATEALSTDGATPLQQLDAHIDARLALGPHADADAVRCWVGIAAESLHNGEVRAVFNAAIERELNGLHALIKTASGRKDPETRNAASAVLSAIQGAMQLATATDAMPAGFAASTVRAMARGLVRELAPEADV